MIRLLVLRDKAVFFLAKIFLNNFRSLYYLPNHQVKIVFKIKTSEIKNFVKKEDIENLPKNKFIWKGNWDKNSISINKYQNHNINFRSMFEIFKKKMNFKTCNEYQSKKKMIEIEGSDSRGNKSIKELDNYFNSLKKVKKNMKLNGYVSQNNLSKNFGDEIGVFINRKGEILKPEDKFGGTHRFAISKILKVKYIYVRVRAIHMNHFKKIFYSKKKLSKTDAIIIQKIQNFI